MNETKEAIDKKLDHVMRMAANFLSCGNVAAARALIKLHVDIKEAEQARVRD